MSLSCFGCLCIFAIYSNPNSICYNKPEFDKIQNVETRLQ